MALMSTSSRAIALSILASVASLAACTSDPPTAKHCSGGPGVYDIETCRYEGPQSQAGSTFFGEAGADAADASLESDAASVASDAAEAADAADQ